MSNTDAESTVPSGAAGGGGAGLRPAEADADRGREGRGGRWVAAQFALMASIVAAGFAPPYWPDALERPFAYGGSVLALLGAVLAYVSGRRLGRSLTPFPRPKHGGELVERGPYRVVRHPIYGAGLLFFLGYSLFASVPALVLTAALAALWVRKAALEEEWLEERYPDYADYRRRTPRRFFPRLY